MFQMKEQNKTPEEELSKLEISNLTNKELKVMNIKRLNRHGRGMDEHSEKFNKELKNIKKNEIELKNTVSEIKNTLQGIDTRLDDKKGTDQ